MATGRAGAFLPWRWSCSASAMDLPQFLLDQWLAAYEFRHPPIRFNLASSTGPRWTLGQVLALGSAGLSLSELAVGYAPSEGHPALRAVIAERHGVDPDWVLVTTGAAEALSILFCLASIAGGEVSLPSPGFPAFAALASAWQLRLCSYALQPHDGYRTTSDRVLGSLGDRPVLALVNSPHNPTGAVMPRSEIAVLAAALAERRVPLVVDEVYHPLYFGDEQQSAAGIANTIIVGDMSKAMSLAGTRIGWIIDADAERRKRIIDARSYFTICSSPLSEAVAAHALRNAEPILARLKAVAGANLPQLAALIEGMSEVLDWVAPAGGTTAYPWFRDGRDSRSFCARLAERGVLVAPGDCFGQPQHMRIGFAAQEQGFEDALGILEDTLTQQG